MTRRDFLGFGAFGYKRPAALNGPQFPEGSILKRPLAVRSGCLSVPTGPGLGVEVGEVRLKEG